MSSSTAEADQEVPPLHSPPTTTTNPEGTAPLAPPPLNVPPPPAPLTPTLPMSAPPMPTSLYPSLSWNHSGSSYSNLAMVAPQPQDLGERHEKGGKRKLNRHQGKRGTDSHGKGEMLIC